MIFHDLVDEYWSWALRTKAKSTLDSRGWLVASLQEHFPRVEADQITAENIINWLLATGINNPNTANQRITLVSAIFTWGIRMSKCSTNPAKLCPRPTTTIREFFVKPEQFPILLSACPDQATFHLVQFQLDTGCRPAELPYVTEAFWDRKNRTVTLPRGVSKGRKHNRVIYLGDAATQVMGVAAHMYPTGPCLRTQAGQPWDKHSLHRAYTYLSEKCGWPDLVATSLRHSFAHAKLQAGVSPEVVAKLMGHRTTNQIYTRYGHLDGSGLIRKNAGLL